MRRNADLDVLGRNNFIHLNDNLPREFAFSGKECSDIDWYTGQIKFMESHTHFTASAHALRNAGQAKNIGDLKKNLAFIK